jgi:hypothetical protein
MKLRRRAPREPAPTGFVGDHADKLSRVPAVHWPEEERPTGADRDTYHSPIESLFEPVPFPKWLRPRGTRKRKA